MSKLQSKLILIVLLTLSAGSFYPYYQSINSRSLAGDFIIGLLLWMAVKGLQLSPDTVADGQFRYLVVMGALSIDIAIVHAAFREITLSNLLLSGASLFAPLLAMRVGRRAGVIREVTKVHAILPVNLNSVDIPQNTARTVFQPQSSGIADAPRSDLGGALARSAPSVLDLITKTPVSTLLIAQPGTGKTMTASSMGRRWVEDGHHVFYIDSKADEKEISLWDDACSERYQFDGTLLTHPDKECERLVEAFAEFEAFRLRHLGDGKQTICILDELPAVMAVFKTYKPDTNAVLNFINRIVNRLPSRNCHILAVTQNPSCMDTLPTGTLGTLKKIILTKSGSEAELQEWKGLTVMKPIDLSGVSSAIRRSPVDRGCYYSVVQEWLPMESLIREGDYNRDTLSGGGVLVRQSGSGIECGENSGNRGNFDVNTRTHAGSGDSVSTLMLDVLAYFENTNTDAPRTVRDIRMGSRIRKSGASVEEVEDVLSHLCQQGQITRTSDGWQSPSWENN